ncbi:hypothetical protein [Pedobacter sp. V48]|uniref:hypothetical protein n=1 Tax=Pedobacter sp. V48 TaxID=509635 RepID=UPI0003E4E7DE|nr:hypothetical protein [Pedobacter sp. V48]ETZ20191.1 hypothetical protein N824_08235 [Pedobacter sp. V48]
MIEKVIVQNLKESSMISATELINTYVDQEEGILNGIGRIQGIKSEFYCDHISKALETSKFLSIYSDFTSLFMLPNRTDEHLIHYYPPEDHRFIKRNITFPPGILNGHVPKPHDLLPAYTTHTDNATRNLITELSPFIDSGKLLIRPIRTIMLYNAPITKRDAIIYYANSDTPTTDWKIKEMNEKDSFVIDNGLQHYQSKVLYEITLPFIDNISAENLSKILKDETDLLGNFRVTLKNLMNSTIDPKTVNTNEIYNDKLRPELESINRKFKSIKDIHKLGTGATLAAITISLVAINANLSANFQSLFNTFAGTGTLGFMASEIRYQTEESKLKDNPYFLLWKISRANK